MSEAPPRGLEQLVDGVIQSYASDPRARHINRRFLPSREEIVEIIDLFLELFYPGYYGRQGLTDANLRLHVEELVAKLRKKLAVQIEQCLCHAAESGSIYEPCADEAQRLSVEILSRVPKLRALMIDDVQAAYDGDPAATSLHEVILAYPGLLAVTVYRVAHELHDIGVPLLPRIMTEWAHARTGADIHPAAHVGRSFFIDHATGVVVGETTEIGAHVKLYQGVTLGALSHPRDADGRVIRNEKRHPTVEDEVTVYANATVLGGKTTLGRASVVGGSVFLTRSVPEGSRVAMKPPELNVRPHSTPSGTDAHDFILDFDI